MTLTKIENWEINQLGYVGMTAMTFTLRNITDLERIAETFCSGDLSDAFGLCLNNGMNSLLQTCDLDDEMSKPEVKE